MESTQIICRNCGAGFSGKFCNLCGEKAYTPQDKKLSHLFEEIFHFITHFDSKFLRTLWLVFSKPGFVSKEYCEGRRKKYFKPISLFLISIVIYLLFPLLQGMNISLSSHINNNRSMHINYSLNMARNKMVNQHITEQTLVSRFNQMSPKFAKVLLLILLPLTALSLSLIFWNKKKYFFDHFMLATEFNTFFLLALFIMLPLFSMALSAVLPIQIEYGDNLIFWIIEGLLILTVLIISFRRFYSVSFLEALIKSILFVFIYLIILFIYRQIIFIAVMFFI